MIQQKTISIVNLFFVHRSACLSKVFGVFDKKKRKKMFRSVSILMTFILKEREFLIIFV